MPVDGCYGYCTPSACVVCDRRRECRRLSRMTFAERKAERITKRQEAYDAK